MDKQELEGLLIEWGLLSKYTQEKREGPPDCHVLERGRAFAPGTRAKAALRLVGRDGLARRTLMARELAECGIRVLPMDYVEPIRGTESRHAGPRERLRDMVPAHLRPVHDGALALYRIDTLSGLCLRQQYCGYGGQEEKAARVTLAMDSPVGLRMYREALATARGWMLCRLTS